ncbi:MAG: nuclear transport factor 2 family protein [Candidatus Omnitrophica bacterium]|nr:nuclear transport factor 2 family protein [Candidatus Omnitrophota bacterium]MCB9748034.1 nuclear transport factor 2 family protein [Candidatus Omnitrophota bacterium]
MKENVIKRVLYLGILLILGFVFITPSFAQVDSAREKDHQEIRQLLADVTNAINTEDTDNISSFFTKEYIYVGADQSVITHRKEFLEYYNKLLGGEDALLKSLNFKPKALTKTKFIQDNVGIVHGESDDTYVLANGHKTNVQSKWSATLLKEGGKWKVASLHNGVNFYDNPEIDNFINFWKMIALGALVVGFILGFVVKGKAKSA